MRKILLIAILGSVIGYLLYKVHWLLGYGAFLAALWWAIKFAPEKWRRRAIIGYVGIAIWLLSATILQIFLARSPAIHNLAQEALLAWLGVPLMQYALAALAGLAIAATLVYGGLWLAWFISAEFVLHLSPDLGITRSEAIQTLRGLFLQSHQPSMIIENGQVTDKGKKGWFRLMRGPGLLIVRPGNAVVLEGGDGKSRALGAGTTTMKSMETVRAIVDLQKQESALSIEHVLTRDRIPLSFELKVTFQIESRADTDRRVETLLERKRFDATVNEQQPVYEETLRRAVYRASEGNWRQETIDQVHTALRAVVASYDLDELLYRLQQDNAIAPLPIASRSNAKPPNEPETTEHQAVTRADPLAEQQQWTAVLAGMTQQRFVTSPASEKQAISTQELVDKIREKITKVTLTWGVRVHQVDIIGMQVPPQILDTIFALWQKRWEVDIAHQDAFKDDIERISKTAWLDDILSLLYKYDPDLEISKIVRHLLPLTVPTDVAAKIYEANKDKKQVKDSDTKGNAQ